MRTALLGKVYPWLLPVTVTAAVVLSLSISERIRRNTPVWKFDRVHVGMRRERVEQILGPPLLTKDRFVDTTWQFEECWIQVRFDDQDTVFGKKIQWFSQTPGPTKSK